MKKLILVFGIAFFLGMSFSLYAQPKYRIVNQIKLGGEGGWDYISVDEVFNRLYVSHATTALIVDLKTGKVTGKIPDTNGIHGIAVAPSLNKGFTSNGRDNSVTVFNLKTLAVLGKIKVTGSNPDAILYDPFSLKLFTFNGRSANATVIDARTDKVVATISLPGKPEFSVTDGNGKIYVNIEDKSEICVLNTRVLKIEKTWSIAPGEDPSGLALDNATHRLFSVCSNKLMVISDAEEGKVITTLPIGERCDGVAFDPGLKRVYSSNGEGTITVVQESPNDSFKVIETIPTKVGARTIAVDTTTHHLYLPTAEYITGSSKEGRPVMKPGSFMVLDIAPEK